MPMVKDLELWKRLWQNNFGKNRYMDIWSREFIACKNTMETMKWKEWFYVNNISLYSEAGIVEVIERQVDGYIRYYSLLNYFK